MESNKFEDVSLKDLLDGFLRSYARRDTDMAFSDWLADKLRQELPEMELGASAGLADEITGAAALYEQKLNDLNRAVKTGQSQEEWLSEQLEEAYAGMPLEAAGTALQRMEIGLASCNMQIAGETGRPEAGVLSAAEAEPVDWDESGVRSKAYDIVKQLNSVALCAAASALDRSTNGEKADIGDILADAFRNGLNAAPSEVKAVVTGAVRAAAEKGLTDDLSLDIPIEVICGLAGAAVEGAEALCDAANEDISMTEAVDRIGYAAVAVGCLIGTWFLKEGLLDLPGGPVLVDLLGGLLGYLESSQFANGVYDLIRDAAVAAWEGIKRSDTVNTLRRQLQQE